MESPILSAWTVRRNTTVKSIAKFDSFVTEYRKRGALKKVSGKVHCDPRGFAREDDGGSTATTLPYS